MKKIFAIICLLTSVFIFAKTQNTLAAIGTGPQFYASPTGSPSGDGSINNPWDLQTALLNKPAIVPGSTIWLRGGTYTPTTGRFTGGEYLQATLQGTPDKPIIIRQYPGERAIIDLQRSSFYVGFRNNTTSAPDPSKGHDMWLWGFEVYSSNTPRTTSTSGSWGALFALMDVRAPGTKIINMVIHDLSSGPGFWSQSYQGEAYGNLIYHIGWNAPDRGHGHGIYTQNEEVAGQTPKIISDNIIFEGANEGIQAYGSGAATISNFQFLGNTIFDNGSLVGYPASQLIIAGGGTSKKNIFVENNVTYLSGDLGNSSLGWNWDGVNQNIVVKNNYFLGGDNSVAMYNWTQAEFTGNTIYSNHWGPSFNLVRDITKLNQNSSGYLWNNNKYFGASNQFVAGSQYTYDGIGNYSRGTMDFANWKSTTGFDSNSTYTSGTPKGVTTLVRPNKFEPGRANITIINYDLNPTVALSSSDLVNAGVKIGDRYEVRDAQNYFGGSIVSGTYSGGSITIPMTGLSKVQPIGISKTFAHTAPRFGTFVLLAGEAINGAGTVIPQQAILPVNNLPTAVLTPLTPPTTTPTPTTIPIPTVSVSQAPVIFWNFDNINGSSVPDSSGNNVNAVISSASSVSGRVGQGLQFNGLTSTMSTNDSTRGQLISSMTLSAWIKTSNTRAESIISRYDSQGIESGFLWKITPTGVMSLRFGGANIIGTKDIVDTTRVNDGQWHFVTLVINLGQNVQFYVDGNLSSNSSAFTFSSMSSAPLMVGGIPYEYYAQKLTGTIDEVRIYNRALSASEISGLRTLAGNAPAPTPIPATTLVPTPAGAIAAQTYNLNNFMSSTPVLDGQWQGIKYASDGNVYFGSSSHDSRHGAAFFKFDPRTNRLTMLSEDITKVVGENPLTNPQGKLHSDIVEKNGWLYFATYFGNEGGYYSTYTGSHVVGYNLSTGQFKDFGIAKANHTTYSGIGIDPTGRYIYLFVTGRLSNQNSYLYKLDIQTGEYTNLGVLGGASSMFYMFVDQNGYVWFTQEYQGGTLFRYNPNTNTIDKYPNALPQIYPVVSGQASRLGNTSEQNYRAIFWMQPIDGNKALFTQSYYGGLLYMFDASKPAGSAEQFTTIKDIGYNYSGMTIAGNRLYYIQRANRGCAYQADGQPLQFCGNPSGSEFKDFHLMSVSLDASTGHAITDHGLIQDQNGRVVWRMPSLATDGQSKLFGVGDWYTLPGDITSSNSYRPSTNRSEFFTVMNVDGATLSPIIPTNASITTNVVTTPTPIQTTPIVVPAAPLSMKFSMGNYVQVDPILVGSLNVRSGPGTATSIIGIEKTSAFGTVVGGPIASNNLSFWNINFQSGNIGWSAEDYLKKITSLPTPLVVPTTIPTPIITPPQTPTPTPTPTIANAVISTSAPAPYWSFDAGTINNSTVSDISGSGIGGSIFGTITTSAGRVGQSLLFNGSANYINAGHPTGAQLTNSITLTSWVKTANVSRNESIISRYDSAGTEKGYLLKTNPSGNLVLRLGRNNVGQSTKEITDPTKINDGQWHFVAIVITLGQDVKFYVDNILTSTSNTATIPGSSEVPLLIGSMSYEYYAYKFTGSLDEVRIYNRSLSSNDISQLYNLVGSAPTIVTPIVAIPPITAPTLSPTVVASNPVVIPTISSTSNIPTPALSWTFDNSYINGNSVLDKSVNNLTGNANSTLSVPGRVSQALQFNGSNSSVTLYADNSKTQLNQDITLSAWVKTTNNTRTEAILSKYDSSGTESGYLLNITSGGVINLRLGGNNLVSGSRDITDTKIINDGQWHHVVVVISIGQNIKFYVDGNLGSSHDTVTKTGIASVPFQIGTLPYTYYANYFTGSVDEVRIFDSALNTSDVSALYNSFGSQASRFNFTALLARFYNLANLFFSRYGNTATVTVPDVVKEDIIVDKLGPVKESGNLYQIQGGNSIYIILSDGTRYQFKTLAGFKEMGYKEEQIQKVSSVVGDHIKNSFPLSNIKMLTGHPTGTFFKYVGSDTIYVVQNGKKREVLNIDIVKKYTDPKNVITIPKSYIYPDGLPLGNL